MLNLEFKKIAALDLGSNSFLCLLCEANSQGEIRTQKDLVDVVRLGQGLTKNKKFSHEALQRAKESLLNFKKEIDIFNPQVIKAYATAAARDAENGFELIKLASEIGIPVEIISGLKEAEVTYKGVFWGESLSGSGKETVLIDIGGRSTEIMFGSQWQLKQATSINMGVVSLTENFISEYPIFQNEILLLENNIKKNIAAHLSQHKISPDAFVYASSGTATTLAMIELGGQFIEEKINGFELNLEILNKWAFILSTNPLDILVNKYQVPKNRSDVLFAGCLVLQLILKYLNKDKLKVSTRGIRYGIVAEVF